jgi:hypothetical protein
MTMSTLLIGQNHNTYEDFYKSRWKIFPSFSWARQDTIFLTLSQKEESQRIEYGEFIHFKESNKVSYQRFMACSVGTIYTTIENFLIFEDKAYLYYKTKPWRAKDGKWKKKHKKYRILKYDGHIMKLKRI